MTESAILYALSTIAQTCAALAALVGALAIYQINSLRDRHGFVEREIRALILRRTSLANHLPIETVLLHARDLVLDQKIDENEIRPKVDAALREWDDYDNHFRRSKRLLTVFVGWNLVAIFISLVGFAFVYSLMNHWASWVILWVVAICTVAATAVMLMEVHGSLERFRECPWLRPIFTRLERSEPFFS